MTTATLYSPIRLTHLNTLMNHLYSVSVCVCVCVCLRMCIPVHLYEAPKLLEGLPPVYMSQLSLLTSFLTTALKWAQRRWSGGEAAATSSTCAGGFAREAKGSSQSSRWLWQRSLGGSIIRIAATAAGKLPWCWFIISVFESLVSVISFFICPQWRHQSRSLPDLFQMNPSFYRLLSTPNLNKDA